MADDDLTGLRNESIKHIATYGGSGAGVFTLIGYLMWGDVSQSQCPVTFPPEPCPPHFEALGFSMTSAEQFGLFVAGCCLLGCLALMALAALTSKPPG